MKKLDELISVVAKTLGAVAVGGEKGDPALAALDRGVLAVALLIAALDGTILPAEYAAFAALAKRFAASRDTTGGTASVPSAAAAERGLVRTSLDAVAPEAGRLVVMAQTGAYDEEERLAALVEMAAKEMPKKFSCGSLADLRRAFALWTAIAVADGTFSELERKALDALAARFAACGRDCLNRVRKRAGNSPADVFETNASTGMHASTSAGLSLLEADFLDKAEKIVRQFSSPEKREKAEAELAAFVGTVESVDANGARLPQPAAGVALAFAAACLTVG